ncbi:hypothetical protein PPYR_00913 [Photinus pyralis]|uniref:Peptidase M13 N-terminal domain-containing protein n=1 Tax=Photinus pyralis TaxID=7054 RepID=A0A5N4B319_PHOPY|nr:neprilysin-2-like isoform X1 [Photinus pyralis]KAB0803943.1 hypothetical protein PPYR_00913 [Photinus pyralis]
MELNRSSDFLTEIDDSAWIRRRTRLEKGLMVALILASAAILGFFINMVTFDVENERACHTPNCVVAAAHIVSHIDESVDPCDDFFRFACGKVLNVTPREHHPKRLLDYKIEKQLQNLLEEPIRQSDPAILNYEKRFYQACIEDKNGSKGLKTLKGIFQDLGGWPVVVGSSWDETKFNWLDWVPKFYKHGLNHMQILRYTIEFESENSNKRIIKILPPYQFLIERTREIQRRMLIEVATLFGAEEKTANSEMIEVMDLMWNIDKLKEEYINYSHPITQLPAREFQKIHTELDWLHYFNSLTKSENIIKMDEYFSFRHTDCVKAILGLVQRTPKRTIANYMFWCAVEDLLPVLTTDIIEMHNIQECLWSSSRKTRLEMCKRFIRQNFSPMSLYVAYAKKYLTSESKTQATDIFNRVKKEFKKLFEISTWMSEGNKINVTNSFNTMTEIIGLQHETLNVSMFDEFFNKLKSRDEFLKMYLNLNSVVNEVAYTVLPKDRWMHDFVYFNFITDVETIYIRSRNTIIIPAGMLQDWYYDEEKPMYVNFATIGKNIGATFANMVTGVHVFGDDAADWSEETKKGFEEVTSCIRHKNEVDLMAEYYDYKKLEVGQITGLKVAYNAYLEWMKDNREEKPLKGIGYTSKQLFWISAVTDSCHEDDYGFTLFVYNEPIRQNINFAKDFECDGSSKMTSSNRCEIL